jgi:hypothetical protein
MDLHQLYTARIARLQEYITVLKRKKRNLGIGRLLSFVAAIVIFFVLLDFNGIIAALTAIFLLLVFLFIAVKDLDNTRNLKFQSSLLKINEEELKALDHDYSAFNDGSEFLPKNHPYANDLDIFGEYSLFQFINRTTTPPAAALLADRLLNPSTKNDIIQAQEAIRELQPEIDWRQYLQAKGRLAKTDQEIYRQINEWSTDTEDRLTKGLIIGKLVIILPVMTLILIVLAYVGILPWRVLWLSFWTHLLLMWQADKIAGPAYKRLSRSISAIVAIYESLKWMLSKPFSAPLLHSLQQRCYYDGIPAYQFLSRLKNILHQMDLRLNPLVHFPLNLLFFWDWHQYRRLCQWHRQYSCDLAIWIKSYAEMEVLSSFANMAFNQPQWCYPEIADDYFTCSALSLGHPLLPGKKRVCNDMQLDDTGKIMLITGSNMAGKSTFLRTVGINMVLAMAGSVVCAKELKVSRVMVVSSMRVTDNLEENISTFYAELKKLEMILQRVRAHERVFLLLDEILRGTNSQDRHAGARALIRQFLSEKAVGILATHDLALTDMEKEYKNQVLNYHFDVQVQDDELFFDYKLKPGICTSMNASLLMRKIGIEV